MTPLELTNDNFEQEVLRSPIPALVEFWAPWCTHCRRISGVMEQVAGEYAGSAVVAQLNVDDAPDLARRYGVEVIPTLQVFVGGQPGASLTAPTSVAQIRELLDGAPL